MSIKFNFEVDPFTYDCFINITEDAMDAIHELGVLFHRLGCGKSSRSSIPRSATTSRT